MIIQKIKHDIKMRRLRKNTQVAIENMKKHEFDLDSTEFKSWALICSVYEMLMIQEIQDFQEKTESC